MKKFLFLILYITLFVFFVPREVFATVGFAERTHLLQYSGDTWLVWGSNFDLCSSGPLKQCFFITDRSESLQAYSNMPHPFERINVPEKKNMGHIFAKRYYGGPWIIYDIYRNQVLLEADDYNVALEKWKSLGYREPSFATSQNPKRYFREKFSSWFGNFYFHYFFGAYYLVVPILLFICSIFLAFASLRFWKYYKSDKHKKDFLYFIISVALTFICFVSSFPIGFIHSFSYLAILFEWLQS